jgi:hypothetical protein
MHPVQREADMKKQIDAVTEGKASKEVKDHAYGKTAAERPCTTIEKPTPIEHLHATIYHALGIQPDLAYVAEKRPVYVTRDGKGVPALELFA